ncbi:MAG TPA: response regulator [Leptolinea sp.]
MSENILLIDDDEYIRNGLSQMLEMEGYKITSAEDGTQGFEKFQQENFNLVITDIKMPGLDGLGVLGLIHHEAPSIPVILITGHGELNTAIEAMRGGAYDFITKPFQDTVVLAAIHRALEKIRLENELVAAQKLAGIGTLAAGIAHELNTPLNAIIGAAERLLKRLPASPNLIAHPELFSDEEIAVSQKYLEMIQRNGLRCAKIVQALKTYSHNDPLEQQEWDLNDIIRDSLVLIEHTLRVNSNINIETNLTPDLPSVRCDPNKLTQVFINLISNAGDSMPYGGRIFLETQLGTDGKSLVAMVRDEGGGMPPEMQKRIFEPFFTTKPVGEGTGLGLSIVEGILHEHQGTIEVKSQPGQGTTFIITFQLFHDQEVSNTSIPALGRYDKD